MAIDFLRSRWLIGVLAAASILCGSAWYQALTIPAYYSADEPGHVGYVLKVQEGNFVPRLSDEIDARHGGAALQARVRAMAPDRRQLYVAKSPPWPYLLAAPPAALTRALGVTGGPLFGLRLVNLMAATGAVVCTYVLGRELSGGDRRVGLVAAGILGALPHTSFVTALGMIDGIALLAGTATLASLARVCRRGPSRRAVVVLGLAAAAGAAVRSMTLVPCAVAGAIGLAVVLWRRTVNWWQSALFLLVPALLTSGWYYLLNRARYDDATGTKFLVEAHDRSSSGPLLDVLFDRDMWSTMVRAVVLRRGSAPLRPEPGWWLIAMWVALGAGLVGTVLVILRGIRTSRQRPLATRGRVSRERGAEPPSAVAWVAMAVMVAANVLIVAAHVSNGGNPQTRYLIPSLPIACVMVALAAVRLASRWAGIALIVVAGLLQVSQLRPLARHLAAEVPPGVDAATLGPDWLRFAGLIIAGIGGVIVCLVVAGPKPWLRRGIAPDPGPTRDQAATTEPGTQVTSRNEILR